MYLNICKRSVITSGTVYVFRLHQVLNWAVESESKSHKQNHHQHNWKKLYVQNSSKPRWKWKLCYFQCYFKSFNLKPQTREERSWSSSFTVSISLIKYNSNIVVRTTSFREVPEIFEYLLVITLTTVTIRIPTQNHFRAVNSLLLTSVDFVLK